MVLWCRRSLLGSFNDVLVVMPKNLNTENKLRMLNAVDECIQLTADQETDHMLPFLDTVNIANSPYTGSPLTRTTSFITCRGTVIGPSQEW